MTGRPKPGRGDRRPANARQCEALTRSGKRCRNRCEPRRSTCLVHTGLAPELTPNSRLVVIMPDGLAHELLHGGRIGDIVEGNGQRTTKAGIVICCTRCGHTGGGAHACQLEPSRVWREWYGEQLEAAHPGLHDRLARTRSAPRAEPTVAPCTGGNDVPPPQEPPTRSERSSWVRAV
jgi:hypothetical protein